MKTTPPKPKRKALRLKEYDYSQNGFYFITICVQDFRCLFGEIFDGEMILNEAGRIVKHWWLELQNKYPVIKLDEFIIMPNHFHAIIEIVGAGLPRPQDAQSAINGRANPAPTLGNIVGFFKYQTTKHINTNHKNLWQKNYYEHIIRDEEKLNNIRQYVIENPLKWQLDELYIKTT